MNIPKVLSFDSSKIKIKKDSNNKLIVIKKTCINEFININKVRINFNNSQVLNEKIIIKIANLIEWDEENLILKTEFCSGINCEIALKSTKDVDSRLFFINIFKNLFITLREIGFLWGDLAPRNMVIDKENNYLWLFDFERKTFIEKSVLPERFIRFLYNYALEEFSCFLFKDEQDYLFQDFILKSINGLIRKNNIESKRKKILLYYFFGDKEYYSLDEIREIEMTMARAMTPFTLNGSIKYPAITIDNICKQKGLIYYAKYINATRYINEEEKRFYILKNEAFI
ncbi:MAG: hypothetical protein COV57_01780 [Candidatus Liptonbacteria bacterium CG11_big_fil_rev_8_21_14_0_20_35_14]|uniref:Protein kinase domain-containing protein n=1 Tax=Candidatus Liptonbacteria bacterium CG11_big_fil_rev_8_21_14_0_20_35_14 TaxID=1974634 RepID=A0A2H0N7T0_9BACT|nr:MAG: hypothetical protein COV57_01780 [Candidatus Liptonbacteria bacterium CG11_big_fil_rev_8_21_14_0_20_35_14]